jgi:hypothetical protein
METLKTLLVSSIYLIWLQPLPAKAVVWEEQQVTANFDIKEFVNEVYVKNVKVKTSEDPTTGFANERKKTEVTVDFVIPSCAEGFDLNLDMNITLTASGNNFVSEEIDLQYSSGDNTRNKLTFSFPDQAIFPDSVLVGAHPICVSNNLLQEIPELEAPLTPDFPTWLPNFHCDWRNDFEPIQ